MTMESETIDSQKQAETADRVQLSHVNVEDTIPDKSDAETIGKSISVPADVVAFFKRVDEEQLLEEDEEMDAKQRTPTKSFPTASGLLDMKAAPHADASP